MPRGVGLAVRAARTAAAEAKKRAAGKAQQPAQARQIKNIMAYPPLAARDAKPSILEGRPMHNIEQAMYASRNMSLAEIEDALASGVFQLPPSGQTKHGVGQKWWSPADEEGVFGRPWNKGAGTVRVPIGDFTPDAPLSVKTAQRWDAMAKKWVPLKSDFAVGGRVAGSKKRPTY